VRVSAGVVCVGEKSSSVCSDWTECAEKFFWFRFACNSFRVFSSNKFRRFFASAFCLFYCEFVDLLARSLTHTSAPAATLDE